MKLMNDKKGPLSPKEYLESEPKEESGLKKLARWDLTLVGWRNIATVIFSIVIFRSLFIAHFIFKVPIQFIDNSGQIIFNAGKKSMVVVLGIVFLISILAIGIFQIIASEEKFTWKVYLKYKI